MTFEFNYALFFHIAGIIIGLGAVTVIDFLGLFSRKSIPKTQVTIQAHHTTKPLIWIGTIIILVSWIFIYENSTIHNIKSILLGIMILNGVFLSFYVSPILDTFIGKKALLPESLQNKIKLSMIISFVSWWSFVVLTVATI